MVTRRTRVPGDRPYARRAGRRPCAGARSAILKCAANACAGAGVRVPGRISRGAEMFRGGADNDRWKAMTTRNRRFRYTAPPSLRCLRGFDPRRFRFAGARRRRGKLADRSVTNAYRLCYRCGWVSPHARRDSGISTAASPSTSIIPTKAAWSVSRAIAVGGRRLNVPSTITCAQWLSSTQPASPSIDFVSNSVERIDDHTVRVNGELTLLGVTKPLTLT